MSQTTQTAPLLERLTQKIDQARFTPKERSFLLLALQLAQVELDAHQEHCDVDAGMDTVAVSMGAGRFFDTEGHQPTRSPVPRRLVC